MRPGALALRRAQSACLQTRAQGQGQASQAFAHIGVADIERRHEAQHVWAGLQQQQALLRGVIENDAGLALVRISQHRAQHQAATAHLGKHVQIPINRLQTGDEGRRLALHVGHDIR